MQALMSFESAPPLAAPLRFFLTAPLFVVLAGALIAYEGPSVFDSRWGAATLALTHLITIGFMMQTMFGALVQILPVVAGANLARPLVVASWVHASLTISTLGLVAGFYWGNPEMLRIFAVFLALTVGGFLAATWFALRGVPTTSPTIHGLKLALAGLFVVTGLGLFIAQALAAGWPIPLLALTDLHAGWGLAGWGGILLAAVAYVVVPMFQLTPGYPARPSWWFPRLLLAMLLIWSAAVLLGESVPASLAQGSIALAGIALAGLTLHLQARRRRARPDASYRYWQFGLSTSILALLMLLGAALAPALADDARWTLVFGILLGIGGFLSFMVGMLYKIVPFLSWLHLQNAGQARIPAPSMNKILADSEMQHQRLAHMVATGLLIGAVLLPELLTHLAGAALTLANGWLTWNLVRASRRYRKHLAAITEKLAAA